MAPNMCIDYDDNYDHDIYHCHEENINDDDYFDQLCDARSAERASNSSAPSGNAVGAEILSDLPGDGG